MMSPSRRPAVSAEHPGVVVLFRADGPSTAVRPGRFQQPEHPWDQDAAEVACTSWQKRTYSRPYLYTAHAPDATEQLGENAEFINRLRTPGLILFNSVGLDEVVARLPAVPMAAPTIAEW